MRLSGHAPHCIKPKRVQGWEPRAELSGWQFPGCKSRVHVLVCPRIVPLTRAYSPFGSSTALGLRPIGIYRIMTILRYNSTQRHIPDNCRDNNFLRGSSLLLILALFSWFSVSGCGGVAGKNTPPQGNGQLSARPASVAFGNVTLGSSSTQAVSFSNTGSANLTVSLGGATGPGISISGLTFPLTLPPGQSSTFSVQFAPTATGSVSGSVSLVSDAPNSPGTIALSGTGVQPQLSVAPPSVSFGNVLVGSNGVQNLTLTNSGSASLTIAQGSFTGAGFSISGPTFPLTLPPGQSSTLSVQFAPTATGSVSGSVSLVSNAPNSPSTIALSGTGVQPQLSVAPPSVSFGNVLVGSNGVQTITLTNPGTANLTISQATVSEQSFTMTGLNIPLILGAGQTTSFNVAYVPSSAGSVTGSLSLVSDAPNSPTTLALSGTGVAATLQLTTSPTSLSFGNVTVGSSTQTVTLTNSGNSSVSISQVQVSGPGFSTSGLTPPMTLLGGQSTNFIVAFTPAGGGSVTGSVSVVSNAANSPAIINLSGVGVHLVTLNWDPSTLVVAGYNIYRGTQSGGPYTQLNSSPVLVTTYTDSTVQAGQAYFYVATAVDLNNVESMLSNEISATIPTP